MKKILLSILTLVTLTATAQKLKSVNTTEFVQECMKTDGELPHKEMAIWFPVEFWQLVGRQMKNYPELMEQTTREMSNYMMFAIVDYSSSGTGITFKSDEEIRKSLVLLDSSRTVYKPIREEDISPRAADLIHRLQPMMTQLLGQFGEGMRIFVFDAKKINGKPVIDITQANKFILSWEEVNLKWKLPLASVLPPKHCSVDGETMKGNWIYCPFHGVKLD